MAIATLDEAGFKLLAHSEGLRLCPYHDIAGIATIGYGSTYYANGIHVAITDPCLTESECRDLFNRTSTQYINTINSCVKIALNQAQFNALFSLCYNIGTGGLKGSTVLKLVNQNIFDSRLKDAFLMWDKVTKDGTHVVSSDLLERRTLEYNTFIS